MTRCSKRRGPSIKQKYVVELYESFSADLKTLIKERKEPGLKKYSAAVHKFLEEIAKIGCLWPISVCSSGKDIQLSVHDCLTAMCLEALVINILITLKSVS